MILQRDREGKSELIFQSGFQTAVLLLLAGFVEQGLGAHVCVKSLRVPIFLGVFSSLRA